MKKLLMVLAVLMISLSLTGCKTGGLDTGISGQIDLMLWSGSGTYYEDLGKLDLGVDDFVAQNDAAAYAVAKEFNKTYPNVKINFLGMTNGPTDNGRIWSQELDNYKNEHGVHPTIWATVDLPGDISKGIVADLSRFSDDPLYKSMNPSIMSMMNYYGFQGGLPQYILPWGIYVNKDLFESNNLDVPDIDWTIEEYTDAIGHSSADEYYGSLGAPIRLIETGVTTLNKQLFEYQSGSDFVNLNSTEIRSLIPYLEDWDANSVWGSEPSTAFMDAAGSYGYNFFKDSKILTLAEQPWHMGDCATPSDSENISDVACKSPDWDIYPRPSTDFVDNTVGIVLDPMAIYNSCLLDGDLGCTEEEELQIELNYAFASYWIADTASWQARADAEFRDDVNNETLSALNDSFPVTTGDTFNEQMQIWYSPAKHQRFADSTLMPGFQEVVRIYEAGQFWDVSDKAFPYFFSDSGTRRANLNEWINFYDSEINGGVSLGDANFSDTILGNLAAWNTLSNNRFTISFNEVKTGLKTYYGYSDTDFE